QPFVEAKDGVVAVSFPAGSTSPLIAEGKGIFVKRGCFACHGPVGRGTVAAPNLTGVTEKYGVERLQALLRNPNPRMRAGNMPVVDASPSDMTALVAFLGAVGTSAASVPAVYRIQPQSPFQQRHRAPQLKVNVSLPVHPDVRDLQTPPAESVLAGRRIFMTHGCFACHGMGGIGGRAPALGPLVAKLSDEELTGVLRNPNAKMLAGGMPPVTATHEELESLLSYLRTLPATQPANVPAAKNVNPK
ncbi:MAG: cytochrome c, partial [Formivibrio sp.]|nr:cytochrome c [Formivibrio sp.]